MDEGQATLVALVAIGGAIGSVARYGVSGLLSQGNFPWGTFTVNFTGSFALCFLYFLGLGRGFLTSDFRVFTFTGVIGGYTTFSTFAFETVSLYRDHQATLAAVNFVANAGVCLAGAVLGTLLGLILGGEGLWS